MNDRPHIFYTLFNNKNIFIRTVTHHYTGKFVCIFDGFVVLEKAAWIADDGRFSDCVIKGTLHEVEPYFDDKILVSLGAIIDVFEWKHPLPREQL